MTNLEQVLEQLVIAFPDKELTQYCTPLTDKAIWIEDSEALNRIDCHTTIPTHLPEEQTFRIVNEKQKIIAILAMDGNGLVGNTQSSCDAVLLDEVYCCFVEMKYNATARGGNAISRNQQKAIKQLKNTITLWDTALGSITFFNDYKREAYIGEPSHYPKSTAYVNTKKIELLEQYNTMLFQSSSKEF